jgi:Skp family chaperone for outer membrane proteins
VVLVDLKHIFDNYTAFTEMKVNLKTDIAVAENDIKARREKVAQMTAQLKQMQKGAPNYQALEEAITKEQTEINLRITQGRRKFATQEAQVAFTIYKAVLEEVAAYCRRNGVRLAMQHDGKPLTEEDQAQVFQALQHQVLYADPSLDITQLILEQLNRRHAARNAVPGGQPGPRR